MEEPPTELLVRAAIGGDEHAWEVIVDRFSPLVWSVARSHRLDHAEATDVFGEVWSLLAQHIEAIRQPERLAGWLATTARNESLRSIRRRSRERPDERIENLAGVPADAETAADRLILDDEIRALVAALERIDDRCRELLRLLMVEPKIPYEDISTTMSMPIGSIGPTRARCLSKLRSELQTGEAR